MADNVPGTPPAPEKGVQCFYETVRVRFCNEAEAAVTQDQAALEALVNASAEVFANDTAVDLTAADQTLIAATVVSLSCGTWKKADGAVEITSADACVKTVGGTVIDLQMVGTENLGDTNADGDNDYTNDPAITIDETVDVPGGAGVDYCFTVKLTLTA